MKIGILNAYLTSKDPNSYQLQYEPMLLDFLKLAMPTAEFRSFKVGYGDFPKEVTECDGWIITGSPNSAYEKSDWILKLGEWIQSCDQNKIKLLGICFGHQIISHFLGGHVEKSRKGWGVGVRKFNVVQNAAWMEPGTSPVRLLFSHQDQVDQLPTNATLLATDEFCPHQMFCIGTHIFSMQGHPEFTRSYSLARMESRQSLLGEEVFKTGVASLSQPTDENLVGTWIRQFFGMP